METYPRHTFSTNQPPPRLPDQPYTAFGKGSDEAGTMGQRIGWRRSSPEERRWWLIQGVVILVGVLLIGTLMLLALR